MEQEPEDTHVRLLRLTEENNALLKENQALLRKMYRNDLIGIALRIVWYAVLIGLPFAVYFYVIEPYFEAFGANYELFKQGMGEIPGFKGIEHLLPFLGN